MVKMKEENTMKQLEVIKQRHSVRQYVDTPIEDEKQKELLDFMDICNQESGLHMQLQFNEPTAFQSMLAKYGKFTNVNNYIALVGKDDDNLEELGGYYGEKMVIKAQELGLNTCWVALTFNKRKAKKAIDIDRGEKLLMVIALGYGKTQGVAHRKQAIETFYEAQSDVPQWFINGVEMASFAPTARNQQKFKFHYKNDVVSITTTSGAYTKTDMGIVKYHFELGANKDHINWE